MKRCKIGSSEINIELKYWTDGRPEWDLRASQLELYSNINLLQTASDFCKNDQQIDDYYTEMDKNWAVIALIDRFGGNEDLLLKAGLLYERMQSRFQSFYSSLDDRNAAVTELVQEMISRTEDESFAGGFESEEFAAWWMHKVMEQDYYFDAANGTESAVPVHVPGVGAADDQGISSQLQDSASYFIYYMCSPKKLKNSNTARAKSIRQTETLAEMGGCGLYLTPPIIDNILTAGIMQQTEGGTADDAVQSMIDGAKQPKEAKVGLVWFAILAIIVVCVACIVKLGSFILDSVLAVKNQKLAAYLSEEQLKQAEPKMLDFDGDGNYDAVYDPVTGQMMSESIAIEQEKTMQTVAEKNAELDKEEGKNNTLLALGVLAVGAWYMMS